MLITTSWDDGSIKDLRLAEILKEYNIPATFYIPVACELTHQQIKDLSKDFEVGSHTITHRVLTRLEPSELYSECRSSKENLEKIINKEVTSFCYPKGYFNTQVKNVVKLSGYSTARNVEMGHIDFPTNPFEQWTTVHVYPAHEDIYDDWFKYAKSMFLKAKKEDGYFHIWGHSWEVEKYNQWDRLIKFFQFMEKHIVQAATTDRSLNKVVIK